MSSNRSSHHSKSHDKDNKVIDLTVEENPDISNSHKSDAQQGSEMDRSDDRSSGDIDISSPPQQNPDQSNSVSPVTAFSPPRTERIIVKLTVNLLKTFNLINQKYYAAKKKRATSSDVQRQKRKEKKARHNNGHDDKDYNYIIKASEKLNDRYVVQSLIGKGSFGLVVRADDSKDHQPVAVKIVKSKSAFFRQAQIEIQILRHLQKEPDKWNIVKLKDKFMHQNHQCLVFELLSLNLFELLKNTRFLGVSLNLIAKFGKQLLKTLSYLSANKHGKGVIHCDLKPENILLRQSNKSGIKVIDFGSACFSDKQMYTYIQSRFYRAPEVLLGLPYSTAIDMWSLGCILIEMHTGRPLFDGENEADQVVKQVEILGIPPSDMLERGKKSRSFFDFDESKREWKLKPHLVPNSSRSLRGCFGDKFNVTNPQYLQFENFLLRTLDYNSETRMKPQDGLNHSFITSSSPNGPPTSPSPSVSPSVQTSINMSIPPPSSSSTTTALTLSHTSSSSSSSSSISITSDSASSLLASLNPQRCPGISGIGLGMATTTTSTPSLSLSTSTTTTTTNGSNSLPNSLNTIIPGISVNTAVYNDSTSSSPLNNHSPRSASPHHTHGSGKGHHHHHNNRNRSGSTASSSSIPDGLTLAGNSMPSSQSSTPIHSHENPSLSGYSSGSSSHPSPTMVLESRPGSGSHPDDPTRMPTDDFADSYGPFNSYTSSSRHVLDNATTTAHSLDHTGHGHSHSHSNNKSFPNSPNLDALPSSLSTHSRPPEQQQTPIMYMDDANFSPSLSPMSSPSKHHRAFGSTSSDSQWSNSSSTRSSGSSIISQLPPPSSAHATTTQPLLNSFQDHTSSSSSSSSSHLPLVGVPGQAPTHLVNNRKGGLALNQQQQQQPAHNAHASRGWADFSGLSDRQDARHLHRRNSLEQNEDFIDDDDNTGSSFADTEFVGASWGPNGRKGGGGGGAGEHVVDSDGAYILKKDPFVKTTAESFSSSSSMEFVSPAPKTNPNPNPNNPSHPMITRSRKATNAPFDNLPSNPIVTPTTSNTSVPQPTANVHRMATRSRSHRSHSSESPERPVVLNSAVIDIDTVETETETVLPRRSQRVSGQGKFENMSLEDEPVGRRTRSKSITQSI